MVDHVLQLGSAHLKLYNTRSVWHISLRTSPKSLTELLLKPLFTQYITHTTCASSTIPSKNGK